jgi:hypothetical protein
MGKYYNPASDVIEGQVGRRITPIRHNDHASAMRELRPGEHLYAACDLLIRWIVVCVDEESDFREFYDSYSKGNFVHFRLFALSEEQHRIAA